jgi:hypothetical protein
MDLPVIYLGILIAYGFLALSFYLKNYAMMILSCFLLFGISVHTFKNGISIFPYNNFIVIVFSAVTFAIAAYVSLKATLEYMT